MRPGKRKSEHQRFTIETGIMVFFAHPSSPWDKGTSENNNGLTRQYFPKRIDLTVILENEIEKVQLSLNDRPAAV